MGKVVETYERNYKEEDQKLFRAIINLKEGDQDFLSKCISYRKSIFTPLYIEL